MSARIGELFAGYGGLGLGVMSVLDAEVAWFSEFDKAPSKILAHHWPDIPNHGDITKIDWSAVEPVDILTGGFPCQDVSLAGLRRGLKDGTRSGLWSEFARAIDALKPGMVVIENVRGLLSAEAGGSVEPDPWGLGDGATRPVVNALGAVLGDLADLGYDANWVGVRAADAGAPHGRFRIFIAAHRSGFGWGEGWTESARSEGRPSSVVSGSNVPNTNGGRRGQRESQERIVSVAHSHRESSPNAGSDEPERWGIGGDLGSATDRDQGKGEERERIRNTLGDRGTALTDTDNAGRKQYGWVKPVREEFVTAEYARPDVTWGTYEPAIRRWEEMTRLAPDPTLPDGKNGSHRLSALFVEWMQGLAEGHVTDPAIGISRNDQLKALGNGVVPQQAALALTHLLSRELVSA